MLRRLSFFLVVALALVACDSPQSASTTQSSGAPTTVGETNTTLGVPTWTELPGVEGLPEAVQEELLDLVRITEETRALRFQEPPNIVVVTEAELADRAEALVAEEAEGYPADDALYTLLGLLDPSVDLASMLGDLYSEQVLGFYDGETGELVVPMTAVGFSPTQKATLVHELTHALTDEHFGFHSRMLEMYDAGEFDQFSGYQALIEGDAQHTEFKYLQTLSMEELGALIGEMLDVRTPSLDAAPQFIQQSLLFPYDTGMGFVDRLERSGGWEAVNQAYSDFPDFPASTEQVMTPSDYGRDLPKTVTLPDIDVPGYDLVYDSTWGEFGFRLMLDQALGEETALPAADGWGGDSYYQWFDGSNAAIIIAYQGDTAADLDELEAALLEYARSYVPEEDWVWVESFDDTLYFIAADETAVGESLLAAVEPG